MSDVPARSMHAWRPWAAAPAAPRRRGARAWRDHGGTTAGTRREHGGGSARSIAELRSQRPSAQGGGVGGWSDG
jgi:hypothetical protein